MDLDSLSPEGQQVYRAIEAGAKAAGMPSAAIHMDPYGNTEAYSVFVFDQGFASKSAGDRYLTVMGWVRGAGEHLRRYVATLLVLTPDEVNTVETQVPASGSLMELGTFLNQNE